MRLWTTRRGLYHPRRRLRQSLLRLLEPYSCRRAIADGGRFEGPAGTLSETIGLANPSPAGSRPPSCPWSPARNEPEHIVRDGVPSCRSGGVFPCGQRCPV